MNQTGEPTTSGRASPLAWLNGASARVVAELSLGSTKKSSACLPLFVIVTGTVTGVPAASLRAALSGRPAAVTPDVVERDVTVERLRHLVADDRLGEVDDQRPDAGDRVVRVRGQRRALAAVDGVLAVPADVAVRVDQGTRRPGRRRRW